MANVFSIEFLLFLAVFLIVYGLVSQRFKGYVLLAGSVVYMAFASWQAALFALLFAAANFLLGICIQRTSRPKAAMGMAVAINAMAMVTFKLLDVSMLGLSYYLFSFMAYLVDIYRGVHAAELDPVRFASFSFFFPKYTIGPITRYSELADQLDKPRITAASIQKGLESICLGFILKVLVSDKLGVFFKEDEFWSIARIGYESIGTDLAWLGVVVTSLHIYLDWIAYMYMILGLAELMGFRLPQNFNYPYVARTVGDYYRRWHMTLTRWFKDYIYIPLGGSRKGLLRTLINVLFVWVVTSLWHGNGLAPKYMLWGVLCGAVVALDAWLSNRADERLGADSGRSVRFILHLPLLLLIPISWFLLREPASGVNFIIWGMSLGVIIVLERLWKTFVVDRFRIGERLGRESLTGKLWYGFVSVLAHVWVVIPIILTWLIFTITDYGDLTVYLSRLFPAAGKAAGANPSDFGNYLANIWPYLTIGVIFCFPLVNRIMKRLRKSKVGGWILSFVLAGLFWYAVYVLIQTGSDPMGYAAF